MQNEARRHKHGHLPGDISKRDKIKLREKAWSEDGVYVNEDTSRVFRRFIKHKSVTKQRQRDRGKVAEWLKAAVC